MGAISKLEGLEAWKLESWSLRTEKPELDSFLIQEFELACKNFEPRMPKLNRHSPEILSSEPTSYNEEFKVRNYKVRAQSPSFDSESPMLRTLFTVINSLATGFLLINGASFCDYPNFIYISGAIGLGCWCSACLTCLILALNRILDMVCPLVVKIYFRGYRTCVVLFAPILYGLFFTFLTPPLIFSAEHQTWFFDPRTMKGNYREYTNMPHTINNFSLVFLTCFLYIFFCCKVRIQFKKSFRPKRTTRQRQVGGEKIIWDLTLFNTRDYLLNSFFQIFLQSTLLCLIHLSASVIYVIMQFVEIPKWLTILSQYLWQLAQGILIKTLITSLSVRFSGCPVLIYLLFNQKVRAALLVFMTSSSQVQSVLITPAISIICRISHPTTFDGAIISEVLKTRHWHNWTRRIRRCWRRRLHYERVSRRLCKIPEATRGTI